jgi:leader peptidase (prepilin peptidase) / N-methyltransferase
MNPVFAMFALGPGVAIGSFLNVVAARVPLRQSVVGPRSACPACSATIAWRDNVPLLSFVCLRRRCRSCHSQISWKYPLVELLTALLLAGCVFAFGVTAKAAVAAIFCAVLVAVSVIDLERGIIPNRIVLPGFGVVLAAQSALDPSPAWVVGAAGGALFLLLAALAYPGGMGMGDVKLALLLGAMLGKATPVALMVGMFAALIPSLVLMARHGKSARKMTIPFGPFLSLGGVVALFAGSRLLDLYLHLFRG